MILNIVNIFRFSEQIFDAKKEHNALTVAKQLLSS